MIIPEGKSVMKSSGTSSCSGTGCWGGWGSWCAPCPRLPARSPPCWVVDGAVAGAGRRQRVGQPGARVAVRTGCILLNEREPSLSLPVSAGPGRADVIINICTRMFILHRRDIHQGLMKMAREISKVWLLKLSIFYAIAVWLNNGSS